jgi:S1-C subfamily serine protease
MTNDAPLDGAETGAVPDPLQTPQEAHQHAEEEATIAAETTSQSEAEQAPAGTGPLVTPPPVAGWDHPAEETTAPVTAPTPAKTHGSGGTVIAVAVIVALVIGALAGLAGGYAGARLAGSGASVMAGALGQTKIPTVPTGSADEPVVAAAAAAVPSVVNIDVTEGASAADSKALPDSHPSVPMGGQGSGVSYKTTSDGGTYILTNNHVVENASKITVRSTAGKSWPATVVGRDADNDIAVIKITEKLPTIALGSSKDLVVGQTVVAIGSPFGLEHSVTSGVVSALGRSLPDFGDNATGSYPLIDVIQTDAAINPGNSGGALVDRSGRLVGINTAIYSDSGSSGGIGFAVPVDKVIDVSEQLIANGSVSHPFIGIIGITVTPELAATDKLTVEEGALVEELAPGSGAAKAGVKVGDIVVAVDGSDVRSMDDLILLVRRHKASEAVKIKLLRDGKPLELSVTVGDRPAGYSATPTATPTPIPAPKK